MEKLFKPADNEKHRVGEREGGEVGGRRAWQGDGGRTVKEGGRETGRKEGRGMEERGAERQRRRVSAEKGGMPSPGKREPPLAVSKQREQMGIQNEGALTSQSTGAQWRRTDYPTNYC